MAPLLVMIFSFFGFLIAYHTYGRFISKKIFKINPQADVPSKTHYDGKDFVPSSKPIMFGHHFTSIAGTGPIVGPAIGVIWGWVPALLWVFFGSIFMGAVHDFSALVVSMRHQGRSIADIAGDVVSPRIRLFFFTIVCLALWIVIAIFGLVIALIFAQFPVSVIAVWVEIPIAIWFGRWISRSEQNVLFKTIIAVSLLYLAVYIGNVFPIVLSDLSWMPATGLWTIILLVYAFFASVIPVSWLLQPRDYLNAWQLYVALGLIVLGVFVSGISSDLSFAAPAVNLMPVGAPSLMPFLFITIACGALSGFHCLICSGTSSKQIASEADAQSIGFGSMLMEGALAVVVIIAVSAGLGMAYPFEGTILFGSEAFQQHYASWQSSAGLGSKLSAVVVGAANMMSTLGISYEFCVAIIGVFIASFAGTTLDSATRVQRYVIAELGKQIRQPLLTNKWVATSVAVVSAAALAFSSGVNGKGALALWPLFGAVNQLLGALALLVASVYLLRRSGIKSALVTTIPCLIVMVITLWASFENQLRFFNDQAWLLLSVNSLIVALAVWISLESFRVLFSFSKSNYQELSTESC